MLVVIAIAIIVGAIVYYKKSVGVTDYLSCYFCVKDSCECFLFLAYHTHICSYQSTLSIKNEQLEEIE